MKLDALYWAVSVTGRVVLLLGRHVLGDGAPELAEPLMRLDDLRRRFLHDGRRWQGREEDC